MRITKIHRGWKLWWARLALRRAVEAAKECVDIEGKWDCADELAARRLKVQMLEKMEEYQIEES